MTAVDHAAEVDALARRFPGWSIWFGPFTGSWWALPPKNRGVGDFVEADTAQRLIARIEAVERAAAARPLIEHDRPRSSRDTRPDVRRPSNLRLLEGVTPPPPGRVPVVAWPGGAAR